MTKQLDALIADLLRSAVKIGAEKWGSSNGEVTTEDYEADGVTYTDHICNCEVVNGESPRADFIAKANPAAVMALIAALERARQLEIQASEMAVQLSKRLTAAEKRIAELEASHKRLRETMAAIHNTIRSGGAYTPLASILSAAKRAHEESATIAPVDASPLAVKLPELFMGTVQGGKVAMVKAVDGHWLNKTAVKEAIRAAGGKVEGE